MKFVRTFLVFAACMHAASFAVRAQVEDAWLPAANLSQSGGASAALLALASDDSAYSVWWDAVDGLRYTIGEVYSDAVKWSAARTAAGVDGGQDLRDSQRPVTLPPQRPLLLAGQSIAHLIYFTNEDQLLHARIVRGRFDAPQRIAENATDAAAVVDMSGTLHLAYVVGGSDARTAGIYYSRRSAQPFGSVIVSTPYLRGASAGDVQLSIAADAGRTIVVVWRQRGDARGSFVRSDDGGRSWSDPQEIAPRSGLLGAQSFVSVAATGRGEFELVWRDVGAAGCGIVQRRSFDGGATWSMPQRVLEDASPCPAQWMLQNRDDGLWLIGAPQGGAMLLAVREEGVWQRMGVVQMSVLASSQGAARSLLGYQCLSAAFGMYRIGLIGCDARGDVYVVISRYAGREFLAETRTRWSLPRTLFSAGPAPRMMTAARGVAGGDFVGWTSGRSVTDGQESVFMLSARANNQWLPAQIAVQAYGSETDRSGAIMVRRPSLAADAGRVHVVWQGGRSGRVFYSSAARRDAGSREGWSAPVALPAPTQIGGAPALAVDPWSRALFVMYPVSYNEERGVYVTRSEDGGTTWQPARKVIDGQAWPAVDEVRLAVDLRTREWHALFQQMDAADGSGGRALRYARSSDGGASWSLAEMILADGDLSAPLLASAGDGRVVVVWNRARPLDAVTQQGRAAAPYETWSRISRDGGRTWTARARVPGFGEISGAPSLAADAAGHVFLGAVGCTPDDSAVLLTTTLDAAGWSAPDSAPLHHPSAEGNTLLLLFDQRSETLDALLRVAAIQADGRLRPQIDVLQRRVDVLRVAGSPAAATALPRASPSPAATHMNALIPSPTVRVISLPATVDDGGTNVAASSVSSLALGLVGVVGLIGLALVGARVRRRR